MAIINLIHHPELVSGPLVILNNKLNIIKDESRRRIYLQPNFT
jgi:hypothetical protein